MLSVDSSAGRSEYPSLTASSSNPESASAERMSEYRWKYCLWRSLKGETAPSGVTSIRESQKRASGSTSETIAKRFFFPTDRETFKQLTAQAAFEMLRQKILKE